MLLLAAFAGSVLADQLDDAEAKRRGVTVEIVQLEAARTRIEALEKKVADLRKENVGLRSIAASMPAMATPATTQAASDYMYLGKPITKQRVAELYGEFKPKMIMAGGKMIDIGESKLKGSRTARIWATPAAVGSSHSGFGKIMSVGENYITVYEAGTAASTDGGRVVGLGSDAVQYKITGIDTSKYATDQVVSFPDLIYIGIERNGGEAIQTFVVSAPHPTEEEFAKALSDGFKLNRWSARQKPKQPQESVSIPVIP